MTKRSKHAIRGVILDKARIDKIMKEGWENGKKVRDLLEPLSRLTEKDLRIRLR